ncbi:MAG: hypothetical protein ACLP9L_37870, partial [Thermoguttaceae bacterium]
CGRLSARALAADEVVLLAARGVFSGCLGRLSRAWVCRGSLCFHGRLTNLCENPEMTLERTRRNPVLG